MRFLGDHLPWVLLVLPLLGAVAASVVPRSASRWVGLATAATELVLLVLAALLPTLGFPIASLDLGIRLGEVDLAIGLGWNPRASGLALVVGVMLVALLLLGWEHRLARRRDVVLPLLSTGSALLVVLGNGGVSVLAGAILASGVSVVTLKLARDEVASALLTATHAVATAGLLVMVAASVRGSDVIPLEWQAVLLVLAALLRLGFPPLHGGWFAAAGAGAAMARLLVAGSAAVTSGSLLLQLWPPGSALAPGWLLAGGIGMVYGGFVAMGGGSIRQVAAGVHVVAASLLLLALAAGDPIAAGLATVALTTGPTSLLLLGRAIERRVGSDALASLGGLSRYMPTALVLGIASAGVSALLPVSAGFVAMLLVLTRTVGVGVTGWSCVVLVGFSFVLLTSAATRLVRRLFLGPREWEPALRSDLRWWEVASLVLLLLLAIAAGMVPGLLFAA